MNVRSQHGTPQTLAADTTPDEIDLPAVLDPNQSVWFEFADVAGAIELCYSDADTEGIRVAADGVKGPFALAAAPKYLYAGSSTACRVTVLLS